MSADVMTATGCSDSGAADQRAISPHSARQNAAGRVATCRACQPWRRQHLCAAELTYLLNDIAWLQFLGGLSLVMPMFVVIPVLAFWDKSPQPVFPRWVGFFNLWLFVLVLPGQLMFFIL